MSVRRPAVSLRDALVACATLEPAGDSVPRILAALLFREGTVALHPPAVIGPWKSGGGEEEPSSEAAPRSAQPRRPNLPVTQGTRSTTVALDSTLRMIRERRAPLDVQSTAPELATRPRPAAPPASPPSMSLFEPRQERGLLTLVLGARAEGPALDLERVIDELCRSRRLQALPYRTERTLAHGVQLLIDTSQAMDPFRADQQHLLAAAARVLSADRISVQYFDGCPSRGVVAEDDERLRPWRPPRAGCPLVIVTDLGIGGPRVRLDRPTEREWLTFARRAGAGGRSIVGLVPYEPRRWPSALGRPMTLVHWSERATASGLARALKAADRARSPRR